MFLEPQAAAYLDDKVLDAQLDEQGKARFTLGTQGSGRGVPAAQRLSPVTCERGEPHWTTARRDKEIFDAERAMVPAPRGVEDLASRALNRLPLVSRSWAAYALI